MFDTATQIKVIKLGFETGKVMESVFEGEQEKQALIDQMKALEVQTNDLIATMHEIRFTTYIRKNSITLYGWIEVNGDWQRICEINKYFGMYESHDWTAAKINWSACGSQSQQYTSQFIALLQTATFLAGWLDGVVTEIEF